MVGDRLTAFIWIKQFFALLDQFGGYNGLKQAGGAASSPGNSWWARSGAASLRSRDSGATCTLAAAFVALLWLLTVGVLWPKLETNYRGLPPDAARLATRVHLLVCYGVYGLLVVSVSARCGSDRRIRGAAQAAARRGRHRAGRRGECAATAPVRRSGPRSATTAPSIAATTSSQSHPNERFYSVTKNIVDPDPNPSVWRLEIGGLVDRPRAYTYDDIRALPATTQETTLMCISNYLGGGLMSNAIWTGLPLRDVVLAAGPRSGATKVVLHGADGYTDTYSLEKALEPTTFVAYGMNGAPLPVRHGYPVRILTPACSAKRASNG